MEITLNTNRVLYKTLNNYFKNNFKLSIIVYEYLVIITEDLFHFIHVNDEKFLLLL